MGEGNGGAGGNDYNIELPSPGGGRKNDSSEAEKGTTKALDIYLHYTYVPTSQSNSLHFQAIGKM